MHRIVQNNQKCVRVLHDRRAKNSCGTKNLNLYTLMLALS